jgi:hypothetical protein
MTNPNIPDPIDTAKRAGTTVAEQAEVRADLAALDHGDLLDFTMDALHRLRDITNEM